MEQIKDVCKKTLKAGKRCIVVLDKVSITNPNIQHYWIVIATVTTSNIRETLTTIPNTTLDRQEAISWVNDIKSVDPRIESIGDGFLSLV